MAFYLIVIVVAGILWPISYFLGDLFHTTFFGIGFTVLFALASSLWFATLPQNGTLPSFKSYMMHGFIIGFLAVLVSAPVTWMLCRIFPGSNMCVGVSMWFTIIGIVSLGLYTFLLCCLYTFIK